MLNFSNSGKIYSNHVAVMLEYVRLFKVLRPIDCNISNRDPGTTVYGLTLQAGTVNARQHTAVIHKRSLLHKEKRYGREVAAMNSGAPAVIPQNSVEYQWWGVPAGPPLSANKWFMLIALDLIGTVAARSGALLAVSPCLIGLMPA